MAIKSKLPDTGTSIFTIMSKMAQEHNALNLSQGFPDFEVSEILIELVNKYMKEGYNQYAPMPGVPVLREQIGRMLRKRFGHNADADAEITITSGATEGIFSSITALVHPGDEVIIFNPAYDSYDPVVRLCGGCPVHLTLQQPDFSIDWKEVERYVSEKTKMIIINTPHNPTGTVLSDLDLAELERIVLNNPRLLVLSDEVYEHIIFDGFKHLSVLRFSNLAERSIAVFSFGKTFHATGWKVGYTVAPANITAEIRKVHQFATFSVNTATQMALAEFLRDESNYDQLPGFYQNKRDSFLHGINDSKFEPVPCHGTYFQLLSYKNISEVPDVEMAERLTKNHGIATIPISVFYNDRQDDKILRLCFAKHESTLEKATEILRSI